MIIALSCSETPEEFMNYHVHFFSWSLWQVRISIIGSAGNSVSVWISDHNKFVDYMFNVRRTISRLLYIEPNSRIMYKVEQRNLTIFNFHFRMECRRNESIVNIIVEVKWCYLRYNGNLDSTATCFYSGSVFQKLLSQLNVYFQGNLMFTDTVRFLIPTQ